MRTLFITLFVGCLVANAQDGKLRYHGFYVEAISLHPFYTDDYGDLVGFGFGVSFKSQEHVFRTHLTATICLKERSFIGYYVRIQCKRKQTSSPHRTFILLETKKINT